MPRTIGAIFDCDAFNAQNINVMSNTRPLVVKLHPCDALALGGNNPIDIASYSDFIHYVDPVTGETVAIASVIRDSAGILTIEYTDPITGSSLASLPVGAIAAGQYLFDDITKKCWADVNGVTITNYYRVYGHYFRGGSVVTHDLGAYTDDTLTAPYVVVGVETDPNDIGAAAEYETRREVVQNGASLTITDNAIIDEMIINVIQINTGATLTDSDGNTTDLFAGEQIPFTKFNNRNDGFTINTGANDIVTVNYIVVVL